MIYNIWNINSKFDACYLINLDKKLLIWDLIKIWLDYFLVKWEKWVWKEIIWDVEYIWNLFSSRTIMFQQFASNYYYSYYFKIFSLFIQDSQYINRIKLPEIKRQKKNIVDWFYISKYEYFEKYDDYLKMWDNTIKTINYNFFDNYLPNKKQNLFVFPDLWTLFCFEEKTKFKHTILNPWWTNLYKIKMFSDIKSDKVKNIFTTHSWVFQDWKNLSSIFVFDPYKWYYKNQQNPRYNLLDIVKQIKFFYGTDDIYHVLP